MAVAWNALHLANKKEISKKAALNLLFDFDSIFGLRFAEQAKVKKETIPEQALKFALEREQMRKNGEFTKADELRKKILNDFNLQIEDTPSGPKLKKS